MPPPAAYPICRNPRCPTKPEYGYADRGLCRTCETTGRAAIEQLPKVYLGLLPLVWEMRSPARHDTGRIAAVFGPSEPIDLDADALAGEIAWTAGQWEEIVRDRARLSTEAAGYPAASCELLAAHYAVLLAAPRWPITFYDRGIGEWDGIDAVLALTSLHHRAETRIGEAAVTKQLPDLCPDCGRAHLRQRDGSDTVWCPECHTRWPWDAYADWSEAQLFGTPA